MLRNEEEEKIFVIMITQAFIDNMKLGEHKSRLKG